MIEISPKDILKVKGNQAVVFEKGGVPLKAGRPPEDIEKLPKLIVYALSMLVNALIKSGKNIRVFQGRLDEVQDFSSLGGETLWVLDETYSGEGLWLAPVAVQDAESDPRRVYRVV